MFVMKNITRMIAERKYYTGWCRGVRILTVALACYGWWGVIYPELTMLPSTYEIVYEETEATEAETVQTGPEVVEWNSDSQIIGRFWRRIRSRSGSKSRLLTMLKIKEKSHVSGECYCAEKDAPSGYSIPVSAD